MSREKLDTRNQRRVTQFRTRQGELNWRKNRDKNFRRQRLIANETIKTEGQKTLELYRSQGREEEFWDIRDFLKEQGVHHNMKVYDKDGNLIPIMDFENKLMTQKRFNKKVAETIVERIVTGETLTKICEDPEIPNLSTVRKWYRQYPDFARLIDEAYIERADKYVDDLFHLMDEVKTGTLDPKRATFIADQVKWIAEKLHPKYLKKADTSPINVNVSDDGKVNFQILLHNPGVAGLLEGKNAQSNGTEIEEAGEEETSE